ncbi:transferase activity protein [[Candida] boidinii]|nr:transferase activity protein [[Candida] boidinii]GME73352.1 unnamed protein product [[Candida] boidinii]
MLSRNVLLTIAAATSALAIPKGVPEAFPGALAKAAEASYECHASCGYLILAARECGDDGGPYDESCLCTSGSQFENLVDSCLECGWCLWDDYGSFLTAPLSVCGNPTEPTGTECAAGAETSSDAAEETTSSEAPVETSSDAPAEETTSSEAPAATSTSSEAPAEETTSSEAPAEETTSSEAPAEETTSSEAPAEETTSSEAPAEQTTTSSEAPASTSSEASASADDVETYSGAADKIAIGAGSVFLGLAALLI